MRVVKAVGTLIMAMALGAVLLVLGSRLFSWDLPFTERTTDRSQPVLLKSVQDISSYDAAVGNFEVILDIEKDVDWVPDLLAGERSLFVAAGTVDASVDFSGLATGDLTLSEDGKSVAIRLPEPVLDKPNLDQERTYLFSQDRGLVNRVDDAISSENQQEFYVLAEEKIAAAAKESELIDRARENTRSMLTGMFGALGLTVTFTT